MSKADVRGAHLMPRPTHYSPCINRRLVCALYHEARSRRKPMTRLVDELLTAALQGTAGWQAAHTQLSCINSKEIGYAGRIDLVARLKHSGTWTVIDFKSQKMKPNAKGIYQATFYETWPLQLMAYFKALEFAGECTRKLEDIASVVINSVEPTPVQVKVWPRGEHEACWRAFNCAHQLWCFTKGYHPQAADSPAPEPAPLAAAA